MHRMMSFFGVIFTSFLQRPPYLPGNLGLGQKIDEPGLKRVVLIEKIHHTISTAACQKFIGSLEHILPGGKNRQSKRAKNAVDMNTRADKSDQTGKIKVARVFLHEVNILPPMKIDQLLSALKHFRREIDPDQYALRANAFHDQLEVQSRATSEVQDSKARLNTERLDGLPPIGKVQTADSPIIDRSDKILPFHVISFLFWSKHHF